MRNCSRLFCLAVVLWRWLVEVPRPVLVAVETWRSTNLQIPVQTFPQFFREQTVNKKVGTNVILFSINSPPFLSIGRSEIEKHKPTSRIQALKCDNRADRSLLTNTPQSFDELLSAELCNILRILWYSVRKERKRRCRPNTLPLPFANGGNVW